MSLEKDLKDIIKHIELYKTNLKLSFRGTNKNRFNYEPFSENLYYALFDIVKLLNILEGRLRELEYIVMNNIKIEKRKFFPIEMKDIEGNI